MRERQIHPAILVKIERDDADSRRQILFLEIDGIQRDKFPFSRI